MNHRKIKNTLKHVSFEDAEKISRTWTDPHKEKVWKRIHQKMESKEEFPVKEQITVSQNKNISWKGYLSFAAGIMLFCGIAGYGVTSLRQSGRYAPEPEPQASVGMAVETETDAAVTEFESTETEPVMILPETTTAMTETTDAVLKKTTESVTETTDSVTETSAPITEPTAETIVIMETQLSEPEETLPETIPELPETTPELSDAVITEAAAEMPEIDVSDETDVFAGEYLEEQAGRCQITITKNDTGYDVHIRWAGSAYDHAEWDFSGEFDGKGVLYYSDCIKKTTAYAPDKSTETINYTDGTGYLRVSEEGTKTGLIWVDDIEHAADDFFFIEKND